VDVFRASTGVPTGSEKRVLGVPRPAHEPGGFSMVISSDRCRCNLVKERFSPTILNTGSVITSHNFVVKGKNLKRRIPSPLNPLPFRTYDKSRRLQHSEKTTL
jgi:hypothetical protein